MRWGELRGFRDFIYKDMSMKGQRIDQVIFHFIISLALFLSAPVFATSSSVGEKVDPGLVSIISQQAGESLEATVRNKQDLAELISHLPHGDVRDHLESYTESLPEAKPGDEIKVKAVANGIHIGEDTFVDMVEGEIQHRGRVMHFMPDNPNQTEFSELINFLKGEESTHSSFFQLVIPTAHAEPFTLFAVGAIAVLVATTVNLWGTIGSCSGKKEAYDDTIRYSQRTCEGDIEKYVSSDGADPLETYETYELIKKIEDSTFEQHLESSSAGLECDEQLRKEMKPTWGILSCPRHQAAEICMSLRKLNSCLHKFKNLETRRIGQESRRHTPGPENVPVDSTIDADSGGEASER